MKKTIRVLLVVCLMLALCAPAMAEVVKTPAQDGSLNVRKGPGTNYEVVGWVKNGQSVTVVENTSPWAKIKVDATGKIGYIKASFIASGSESAPAESVTLGTVKTRYAASTVNVRKGPGTAYEVAFKLTGGTALTITGESGNWYQVKYGKNSGYMSKNYVSDGVTRTTTAFVHFRTGAGSGYASNGVLAKNTKVTATGVNGNWTAVTVNGVNGYIYSKYLK